MDFFDRNCIMRCMRKLAYMHIKCVSVFLGTYLQPIAYIE